MCLFVRAPTEVDLEGWTVRYTFSQQADTGLSVQSSVSWK